MARSLSRRLLEGEEGEVVVTFRGQRYVGALVAFEHLERAGTHPTLKVEAALTAIEPIITVTQMQASVSMAGLAVDAMDREPPAAALGVSDDDPEIPF